MPQVIDASGVSIQVAQRTTGRVSVSSAPASAALVEPEVAAAPEATSPVPVPVPVLLAAVAPSSPWPPLVPLSPEPPSAFSEATEAAGCAATLEHSAGTLASAPFSAASCWASGVPSASVGESWVQVIQLPRVNSE